MNTSWFRRIARALVGAGAVVMLAACGSGTVVSDLHPQRIVTVGDGFMDVGQGGGARYTVNDGSQIWVEVMANDYGLTVTPANAGGFGYAQGGACVSASGTANCTAPSVTAQIDSLLGITTLGPDDLVMINGGISDIVDAVAASGGTPSDATTQAVKDAATALGAQVRRVVNAGATHVLVVGPYWLDRTPWGIAQLGGPPGSGDCGNAICQLSIAFNTALEVSIADLGQYVLYVDPGTLVNLMYNSVQSGNGGFGLANSTSAVCTTPDATTCTTATIVTDATGTAVNYNQWLWADSLYPTPQASRVFASNGYADSIYYHFSTRW
jgi:phospholipase/lecithinase/hemolysin